MGTLLKRYYEKYVFQDEDIVIKNLFYDDIDALDKITIPVELCLKKFGCFILTRFFKFKSNDDRAIVRYVLYDDNVPTYYSNITSILGFKGVHPTKCNGYQSNNNVVVYFKNDCSSMYRTLFTNDKKDLVELNDASNFLNNNIIGGIKLSDCEVYEIGNTKLNTSKVINKFKPYIDELNKYLLEPINLKHKHYLLLGGNRRTSRSSIISKAFNVLEHELTHFFDNKNADKINYYGGVNTTDMTSVDPKIDKSMINKAEDVLYRLWSYTEMNAYSVTHGKQGNLISPSDINNTYKPSHYISDIGSVGNWSNSINDVVEYLKNEIKSIASYNNDEFWSIVKNITIKGCRTQKVKDRYSEMSNNTFKNYFIKTSYKLLDKFRDKTIKKGTQQALYNKDTMLLAKEIRNAININNSDHVYSKSSPFEFKMTFPYYFESKGQTYNITFTMSSDNTDRFMRDRVFYFNDNIDITLECNKLNLKYKVKSLLSKLDSFFNLYCELLNKPQRKSYLDRIAVDMASDLRFVLNQVNNSLS